jgi:hypothetical protein
MGKRGCRYSLLAFLVHLSFLAHPQAQPTLTIAGGVNKFSSSRENQIAGSNSGFFGRFEFLYPVKIPVGVSMSLGYALCPVCDGQGGEYVAAYSLVVQLIPSRFPFQLLSGLGIINGKDNTKGGDVSIGGLNIPIMARLIYKLPIASAYIATGLEISADINNRNNVFAISLPLQVGLR